MALDFSKGLEGIIAGESAVSLVDGTRGRLLYRGYRIEDLGAHASFEEVIHLLVYGTLPTSAQLTSLKRHLAQRAPLPLHLVRIMEEFCPKLLPIDALRSILAHAKVDKARRDEQVEIAKAAQKFEESALEAIDREREHAASDLQVKYTGLQATKEQYFIAKDRKSTRLNSSH